jgi:orotidine-5'-phosphate decarboxylase
MTRLELIRQIKEKHSFLCVGLDTDIEKIPKFLLSFEDPIFEFNKRIIDATKEFCVAYKPNLAFYERHGELGLRSLRKTIEYIPKNIFVIADAKRGDIGNTSTYYAEAFFNQLKCDAVTVTPYMGSDSVRPFLGFEGKWAIVLAMTSNEGSIDFQFLELKNGTLLAEEVTKQCVSWGSEEELMFVIGATRAADISRIRKLAPNYFFLVPGVGAQGGALVDVVRHGWNKDCGLLVNASRSIIYASDKDNFELSAAIEAKKIQKEMSIILSEKNFVFG